MKRPLRRLLAAVSLPGAFCCLLVSPASALVLLAESRSVTVSYYGAGIETIASDGSFGVFAATALGTPFGGGYVNASQYSNITTSAIEVRHSILDSFGPGGYGASNFQVRFSLPEATRISISGVSSYFSGPASLVSETNGSIPLVWGPDTFFRNYLEFDQVLAPGIYTFTSNEWLRGDGISTRLLLREVVAEDGSTFVWLALGLVAVAAGR